MGNRTDQSGLGAGPQGCGSIFQFLNYGFMFGSLEWGVPQHLEITLDGLIWDLGVFNSGLPS